MLSVKANYAYSAVIKCACFLVSGFKYASCQCDMIRVFALCFVLVQ
jgi:hypothetical protein